MVYTLSEQIGFPDPRHGEEDGLFALGGDLSIPRLQLAYSYGILPWFPYKPEDNDILDEDGRPYIQWFCPMDRFVLLPGDIHISHSMRQLMKQVTLVGSLALIAGEGEAEDTGFHTPYEVSFSAAFDQVIEQCGRLRAEMEGAWLGPDIKSAFCQLNRLGRAYSVEVWQVDRNTLQRTLVGGLYGYHGDGYFCGESMFSLVPSASKIALIVLATQMERFGYRMIDLQFETDHLRSMGGRHISYEEYLRIIYGPDNMPLKF